MKLSIIHRTTFLYSEPALENVNEVRLHPLETLAQHCDFFVLKVVPAIRLRTYTDLFQNRVHHFQINGRHNRLVIESSATVLTRSLVDYEALPYGTPLSALAPLQGSEECHEFLQDSRYIQRSPRIWREAIDIRGGSDDVFQTACDIMETIFRTCTYQPGVTDSATTVEVVAEHKKGVCQDFAHLMIAYCRCLDIPARYVSGYLWDPGRDRSETPGALRGAHASHAWVEAYVPGHGWRGFDPTNNKVVNDQYVVIATGRDYEDIAPVRGTFRGGGHHRQMHVQVDIRRLASDTA